VLCWEYDEMGPGVPGEELRFF